jgi:hypothetical protein
MLTRFRTFALAGLAAAAVLVAPPAAAQADQEPLPRFEGPVCPGIVGLRNDAAEVMVGRIRANLESFGRRLAEPGRCEPNLIVAVVQDGQDFMAQMRRNNGWVFAELSRSERDVVFGETGPARAFLRIRARTRDGMPIPRREALTDLPRTTMWMAHSKIYTATRNDILSALVLFDRDAIRGLTIDQLADYATFRALTQKLPENANARSASILALFDGGADGPAGLTEFDRIYLGKLYEGLPNIPGPARLAELEKATGRNVFKQ